MKTLDAHMTRRLIWALSGAIVALLLLFVVIDLLTHRRSIILQHDVSSSTVAQYYIFLLPRLLLEYHIAALSMLVSSLFVLGSAAQHNEFTALLSCGVSLRRIARVPFLIACGVSIALFIMGETIAPVAARAALEIEKQYFGKHSGEAFADRPGISANLNGGWTFHAFKFNRVALTGEDILILSRRGSQHEMIRAERIYWDPEEEAWILEGAKWAVFFPEKGMVAVVRRFAQVRAPLEETPEEWFAPFEDTSTRNAASLRDVIDSASKKGVPLTRLKVDYYGKFAKPFLPIVMVCLAVPFASRGSHGSLSAGFGISIALGLSYLLVFSVCQALGYTGYLSPIMAAWLANLMFLVGGAAFLARTPT